MPLETAGLVLVDAAHEDQNLPAPPEGPTLAEAGGWGQLVTRLVCTPTGTAEPSSSTTGAPDGLPSPAGA